MSSATRWVLIIAVLACAGAAYYLLSTREQAQQQPVFTEIPPPTPSNENAESLTRHPIPEPETAAVEPEMPLPALEDSDTPLQDSLGHIVDTQRVDELFIFSNFINRVVVTIDNLPRSKLPIQRLPTKPPSGKFSTNKEGNGTIVINPANYKRYAPYVQLLESADSEKIAALYFHFYPLFQEAYRNLGYKSAYFNDRLIVAIDDLLATPELQEPPKLLQPSVFYKFADPKLESLSAGERLMIRIGNDNAAKVKKKLRELRKALTRQIR